MNIHPAAHSIIGHPHTRVDGRAKVTGSARFASDLPLPHAAHAALVTSPIARGRITGIDLDAARSVPGVLQILTWQDLAGEIAPVKHLMEGGFANSSWLPLGSDEIAYHGQIIALVTAETREAAEEAAGRARFSFEPQAGAFTFDDPGAERIALADLKPAHSDPEAGDADAALARAACRIDARYTSPIQHHNPMEMFTTACAWDGDRLTVYEPTRFVVGVQHGLARQLGIDPSLVRVVAPFIGGHFGSKLALSQHTAIVACAARRLGRPVSLLPTRAQCFTIANHRPETRHRVQLGASADGRLAALVHEAEMVASRFDAFAMEGTDVTASLYACPAIRTREYAVRVDRNTPGPMRAPPEMPYLFALESAVDELACALDIDPIALRRRNDTVSDPVSGKPFTTRPLMRCFDAGADAFGWRDRTPAPGSMRDGEWLVGYGCASSARPVKIAPASVRIVLDAGLRVTVETAHHEIGQGLYTLVAMLVSEWLGLSSGQVTVRLGDTGLPPASLSGGSSTTTSLSHALRQGCDALRTKLLHAASAWPGPLHGHAVADLQLANGRVVAADGSSDALGEIVERLAGRQAEVLADFIPDGAGNDAIEKLRGGRIALSSGGDGIGWAFGAQFAEVRVHAMTGVVHVPRLLGAFAAGAILNPLAARSQLEGGMVWGLGSALLEQTTLDRRTGRYVNSDLSEYLIATAADCGSIEALLLPDDDPDVNALGLKGLGELGIIGVNAAIANAVHHATGRRLRDLPIRIEAML